MNRRIPEPDRRPGTRAVPTDGASAAPPACPPAPPAEPVSPAVPRGADGPPGGVAGPGGGASDRGGPVLETWQVDAAHRRDLVTKHHALVGRMARVMVRRLPDSVDYHDLVSAGTVGLLEAIDRFDPARGSPFDMFASARIRGAMLDEVRAGVPGLRDHWTDRRRVDEAAARLIVRHQREPTAAEVAAETGLPAAQVERVRSRSGPAAVALDEVPADAPALRDRSWSGDPETAATRSETRASLRWALDLLPDRTREIVRCYYVEGMTFARIALRLGLTESRVTQLHVQALDRLRRHLVAVGSNRSW